MTPAQAQPAAGAGPGPGQRSLRGPGEVLLVSCYELGHQPQAVATALAFLERAGFAPAALDVAVEGLDEADPRLARVRLVAIATPMHTALRLAVRVAERVRALRPGVPIAFFGHYALLNREALVAAGVADHLLGGECEEELVRLCAAYDAGGPVLPGALPAQATTPAPLPTTGTMERLRFPVPSRAALPVLARYAALVEGGGERRAAGHLEATRGCLHLCRHCPIVPVYQGRLFAVPVEVVIEDARRQAAAGATHLTFGDPDFLNAPTHGLRVARALAAAVPGITFDITAKVEHLVRHRTLLPELRALGCVFVVSAVESLEAQVLERLDKGHTRGDVERALDACDDARLPLRPTLLPFTPWSTLAGYGELLEWIDRRGLEDAIDPVQLSIRLLVPPGSRLLEVGAEEGWPGALDAAAFTYRWRHRDQRMEELQAAAAAAVEGGASLGDLAAIYRRIAGADETLPEVPAAARAPRRDRPPRLAEAWFC